MRRIGDLENTIYKKKYKDIYRILFNADLEKVSDYSNWYKTNKDYVEIKRPLWIIVESKILNKRIWIAHDWGRLGVDTAQLDLDINSREYSESYVFRKFNNQKEMKTYLENLLEPCLKEYREEEKFKENVNRYKQELKNAEERIIGFCNEGELLSNSKYITLKTIGEQFSKQIANIMFGLGYAEWDFERSDTLENMKEQILDILEGDAGLNKILERKGLTKEQLYRQIKEDFLECEISNYLQDNCIDIGMIPEDIKQDMINQVRKGMLDNYSYKYIIWESGDLDGLTELFPEECFINEQKNTEIEWEEQ